MLCPECKHDTVKNHRTYDSEFLPFRKSVMICEMEGCSFRAFYYLSIDEDQQYTYKDHIIYKRAYERLCQVLNQVVKELEPGENYLQKCEQLSFELATVELKEKIEELE